MPLITVKVFKEELSAAQSTDLIGKITDAVAQVTSDKLREVTWVVIEEINDGHWGVGGNPIGLEDVNKITSAS